MGLLNDIFGFFHNGAGNGCRSRGCPSRGASDAHDLAIVEVVAVRVVRVVVHRHGGRGPQGETPVDKSGEEGSSWVRGGRFSGSKLRLGRIIDSADGVNTTHVLYSMLRISICSVMPAADMNHAAVASADIASCHDAAHVTTAGIAAPTNIALVISFFL